MSACLAMRHGNDIGSNPNWLILLISGSVCAEMQNPGLRIMRYVASDTIGQPRARWPEGARGLVASLLALTMIGALVIARFVPGAERLDFLAAGAAVTLAVLRIGAVPRIARIFVLLALAGGIAVAILAPTHLPEMKQALLQGTAFSAFLTALGLIRGPVRASAGIALAAARLLDAPARHMRAAITYGAQVIAVLFNLGTIGMMSDLARNHAARARAAGRAAPDPRSVTLAALRGTLMMTVWNPIGIGFAIVTAAIPALDPVVFLGLSFVVAMLISTGGLLIDRSPSAATDTPPEPELRRRGTRALFAILAAIAGLIAVTLLIHRVAGVSFLVAACLVLPILGFLWPRIEPSARSGQGGVLRKLDEASTSTAAEASIFLAASVIAAAILIGFRALGPEALAGIGALPPLVLVLGTLYLVPLAGVLMIPHSVVMVLLAQMLGAGPVGMAHPFSLALALCLSWALAIGSSPISAMSLITARELDTTPTRVTFVVNRGFTLYGLAAATLAIILVYLCE